MADDIVVIGGSKPSADERFEALFRAEYEHLAAASETPEQAQRAFLRLWRRRWLVRDVEAATRYLRGDTPRPAEAPGAVDIDRAWHEFQGLRASARRRFTVTVAAAGLGAMIAAALPVLVVRLTAGQPPRLILPKVQRPPPIPPSEPGAIAARIPVSGIAGLTTAGGQLWAIGGPGPQRRFQLVEIDPRNGMVGRRVRLAWQPTSVTAGAGEVWLGTPFGRQRGQVQRFDPATGRPVGTLHLPAGRCFQIAYGARSLWADCQINRLDSIEFLRIDPQTGQVTWRSGPVIAAPGSGQFGPVNTAPMAVAPTGLWYATSSGVAGFVGPDLQQVSVRPPAFTINLKVTTALLYSEGFMWAMAGDDGSVAKIDPATGRVLRIYTFFSYGLGQGLSLTVGQGSLWLLDNGDFVRPSVLQASITTGRIKARVSGPRLCGAGGFWECGQIYATPGAIWVTCTDWLARIDPGRLRSLGHPQ